MQALAVRPDQEQASLTAQQSLQSVQTLLKASLGCITYLRNLLPSENFSTCYLTSSGPASLSSQPSMTPGSFASDNGKRNVSGFKIMTVTRGFTEEADKLLDYMEHGIFDALQKQYLRSFIMAVFLDNDDPNNIVEAYTFNFDYHKIPGTDITVPVMTLDADLERLSLHGKHKTFDPVSDATRQGRVPTLGEVKRSLKTLIKNLIQATTQMDALPKRRFATFKLFYNDQTPDDYEPTHFHAGDAKKDRWFFTTHEKSEVPEKCNIGSLQTGYHGVNVRIASVSGYLPSTEDNNAPFLGTTVGHTHAAPVLTPTEEAAARMQQMEIQRRDAMDRQVVWDADDGMCDADADGEEDPDFVPADDSGVEFFAPIGIRDEEGNIQPYDPRGKQSGRFEEVRYAGRAEDVPNEIAQLAEGGKHTEEPIQQTQQLEETQVIHSPAIAASPLTSSPSLSPSPTPQPRARNRTAKRIASVDSSLPPSDMLPESMSSGSPIIPEPGSIDTQLIKDLIINACTTGEDADMLELDTQIIPGSVDSIHSFKSADGTGLESVQGGAAQGQTVDVVECECGVAVEDCDCVKCEGDCKKWFHMWCMGFRSAKDKRLPARFVCFDCRVKADQNWELIVVHDLYPRMMERFKDLAIFRRAIKVFETSKPDCLSAFTKLIACDSAVAGQVFKRLEAEGFIAPAGETSDAGPKAGQSKNNGKNKARGRQTQRRKTMQKPRYVFVSASTRSQAYKDYFDPDPEVEKKVLGLSDLQESRRGHRDKVKISLGPAVDLGD
ncbi:HORMA-domain-containing protein [Rhodofomes roseus]|uniref:HORMA-domain-containing protein n=1 Tax=Rhodofomes roseus TaxID=34475 RepID=A0ABQ8KVV0_9APHY|nr:HORMA-domain-containing protein [Rhodofomes roseus]KAH9843171.1 HORMA-domain-containing protein [Rhodofomes roseus]